MLKINIDLHNIMFVSRTEDEIGTENFHDLNVPEELIDKFKKMDEAYLS